MITQLLQKTQLSHFKSLVSPAFFDVVPSGMLWREGKTLVGNYRDDAGFADAYDERQAELTRHDLPVRLEEDGPRGPQPVVTPADYAEKVVTLYFHQIWHGRRAIIDLRAGSVSEDPDDAERLIWHPGPMWMTWDQDFRSHLVDIYAGFYRDDRDRFEGGLSALGLGGAADLFERHFGEDVEATRFDLEHFIETFHDIFVFCREHKIEIPGDFVALGVYLATMYENLDRLDVLVNVRRCFFRATERDRARGER